jgi:hypothetical protein
MEAVVNASEIKLHRVIRSTFYLAANAIILMEKHLAEDMNTKNPRLWTEMLTKVDVIIGTFDKAVAIYATQQYTSNTFDREFMDEILKMRTGIQTRRNKLPDSLSEDAVDMKAAKGDLSPLSTKRPVTKKDKARSKVEQLFNK